MSDRFFKLDLVNFDAFKFVGEVFVVDEFVAIVDVFASRVLLKDSGLTTSQRLQSPPQLGILNTGKSIGNHDILTHLKIQKILPRC